MSAVQFGLSLITGLLYLGAAILNSLFLVLSNSGPAPFLADSPTLSSFLLSAGLGLAGVLMIPSVYYSGRRLFGNSQYGSQELSIWSRIGWIFSVFPILILSGYLIQTGPEWGKILLPLLHAAANGTAMFWFLGLVYRRIPGVSAQRFWGIFGAGLTLVPIIAFIIEILILFTLGVIWMVVLQRQPGLMQDLLDLINLLQPGDAGVEVIQQYMDRFISIPGVTATIFIYIAVLVPIVEEILKPILIWLFLGRKLTPREGFLAGAAAGAGYALFENLTIGASPDVWTFITLSRLGTASVHILATGMVGWGIASAGTEKKYLRLIGSFIAAVMIHGTWNGLNIVTALAEIDPARDMAGSFWSYFLVFSPAGVLVLALGSLIGIIWANKQFRRAIITPSTKEREG